MPVESSTADNYHSQLSSDNFANKRLSRAAVLQLDIQSTADRVVL